MKISATTSESKSVMVLTMVLLVVLAGCANRRPPMGDCSQIHDQQRSLFEAPMAKSRGMAGDVLVLSGGGQWGAFGAGYLYELFPPDTDTNRFRLVTGVSTGAMLATGAFLGDRRFLEVYTQIDSDDVLRKKFLWLFSNSYASTAPLRSIVDNLVSIDVIKRVAEESRDHQRTLAVGVVNLDCGRFEVLDLTAIATEIFSNTHDEELVRQRYIDAVMASSAIPVAFPPVFVDGFMYVDGGAQQQLFLDQVYADAAPQLESPEIVAIVNGERRELAAEEAKNNLFGIGSRSLSALMRSSVQNDVFRLCTLANREKIKTLLVSADGTACQISTGKNPLATAFDRRFMNCLFEEGRQVAQSGAGLSLMGDVSQCL